MKEYVFAVFLVLSCAVMGYLVAGRVLSSAAVAVEEGGPALTEAQKLGMRALYAYERQDKWALDIVRGAREAYKTGSDEEYKAFAADMFRLSDKDTRKAFLMHQEYLVYREMQRKKQRQAEDGNALEIDNMKKETGDTGVSFPESGEKP